MAEQAVYIAFLQGIQRANCEAAAVRLLGADCVHSGASPGELKLQHPYPRPMPVSGDKLPLDGRIAGLAREVAAGAGAFEELADDVAGGIDEHADGDVHVAADSFPDVARDVGKLLVENRAHNVR